MDLKLDLWLCNDNIGWVFAGQDAEEVMGTERENVTNGGR